MASYQRLSASDDNITEEHGLVDEKQRSLSRILTPKHTFDIFRYLTLLLIAVNVLLAGVNLWATNALSSTILDITPLTKVAHLPMPDQYVGLSDDSRQKRACEFYCPCVVEIQLIEVTDYPLQ